VVLAALFFVILTPFGWLPRPLGAAFLRLKPPSAMQTFWQSARQDGSLARLYSPL